MAFLLKSNLNKPSEEIQEIQDIEGVTFFIQMLDERFQEFGIGKKLKKEIEIKLDLIKTYIKIAQTGDVFLMNTVNILKAQLESMQMDEDEKEEISFSKEYAIVSKNCGHYLNPKKITVYEYELMKLSLQNG